MSGSVSTVDDDQDRFVEAGRPLPRIESVAPLDDRRVRLTWRRGNGMPVDGIVDLAPALFNHRHFAPLRHDDTLFRQVRVEHWGSALAWPGDIELSAEWISRLPNRDMSNAEFRTAMDDLRMTLDGMAATLGIARRRVAAFRKDAPIPPAIALAMRELSRAITG